MTFAAALLRLALCLLGPLAIWFSWRWTGSIYGPPLFDGFIATSRAMAAFGAGAFVIASLIALTRMTVDSLTARLARAAHASTFLVLYLMMIGPVAHLIAPILAILVTDLHDLARPSPRDGLSARARPMPTIGQALTLTAAGLPLLAAPLGWTGNDLALTLWVMVLWLAAAFKLHRFLPRPKTD